jgi:spore germination protein KA
MHEIKRWILMSKMVILVDGCPVGLMVDAESVPQRPIAEPVIEPSVVGPHDSFVENIRTNTALIRSRLGDAMLKSEDYILGRRSNTLVTLMYVADIANPKIVEEARRRISRIDIDGILDSAYIKELIQDRAFTLFPIMKAQRDLTKLWPTCWREGSPW